MRFKVFVLILLIFLPVLADQPQSQPRARVLLDLGTVTVWLGMPKDEAVKKFVDAQYIVTDMGDQILVHLGSVYYGRLAFKNNRLVFTFVEWLKADTDEVDAVLGALGALAEKGPSPCVLSHQPLSQPDSTLNRVFVICGDRSVLIGHGKVGNSPFVSITERIGELPATAQ